MSELAKEETTEMNWNMIGSELSVLVEGEKRLASGRECGVGMYERIAWVLVVMSE